MADSEEMMRLIEQQQYEKMRQDMLARNQSWSKPDWQSQLTQFQPEQEQQFNQWIQQNKVPFNSQDKFPDYDMRGFYQAYTQKDPRAVNAIDPYDKQIHYPDYWKTPYHETFSKESQWATPEAPGWNEKDQLVSPKGEVFFDPSSEKK
jgi:hypothetical protein